QRGVAMKTTTIRDREYKRNFVRRLMSVSLLFMPLAVHAAYLTNAFRPKVKHIGIVGSYGWGGKMVEQLKGLLSNLKAEILEPVMIKGTPKDKNINELDEFVRKIVELHENL
ncbi:MAG: hypothetical protein U9Q83_05540, partial [Bacteroidota bacterium]|nr:hypothetical protein [Bacteroidota bacterium]